MQESCASLAHQPELAIVVRNTLKKAMERQIKGITETKWVCSLCRNGNADDAYGPKHEEGKKTRAENNFRMDRRGGNHLLDSLETNQRTAWPVKSQKTANCGLSWASCLGHR